MATGATAVYETNIHCSNDRRVLSIIVILLSLNDNQLIIESIRLHRMKAHKSDTGADQGTTDREHDNRYQSHEHLLSCS